MFGNGRWLGWLRVKREARLDPGFADLVASVPGGERLHECIQCGTCSAICPLSTYMEHTPRKLIAMTRAGFKDEVLGGTSIWVCASCYACTAECPKEIPITDLIYALKRLAIKEGLAPRFGTAVLAREFERQVDRYGRNTESRLAMGLYLRTRPSLLLRDAPLARRLMLKGRMGLGRDTIRRHAQLGTLLRSVATNGKPAAAGAKAPPARTSVEVAA